MRSNFDRLYLSVLSVSVAFIKIRSYTVEREKPGNLGVGRAYASPTHRFPVVHLRTA
jgi:hypothetical protein